MFDYMFDYVFDYMFDYISDSMFDYMFDYPFDNYFDEPALIHGSKVLTFECRGVGIAQLLPPSLALVVPGGRYLLPEYVQNIYR